MDIKLHYREKGSGEPLILLHGNGESSAYFIHQLNYFSKWYRVIAVDTRGHGFSPRCSWSAVLISATSLNRFISSGRLKNLEKRVLAR